MDGEPVGPGPLRFFADVPEDVDDRARVIVGDLRTLLASIDAMNAQPRHTSVTAARTELGDLLELAITDPGRHAHTTVTYLDGEIRLGWNCGFLVAERWLPEHVGIVEALLTGRNSLRLDRRRSRIVGSEAEFWPASGGVEPIRSVLPADPGRRLRHAVMGLRPGASTPWYCQVSYDRVEPVLYQGAPYRPADA